MKTKLMAMTAVATMAAVTLGGALDFAWMKGVTDKDPVSYKVGEKMVFTLTAEDVINSAVGPMIQHILSVGMVAGM